jgi:hypothetical protein
MQSFSRHHLYLALLLGAAPAFAQHGSKSPGARVPGPESRVPGPESRPNAEHPTPNTQHPTPNAQHPAPTQAAAGREGEKERPSTLERSSWGKVIGWVMDANTRQPVPGARISVEIEGAFPETGKSTDVTDARGQFEARAPLGKISSKFDWGRLLTMHPISLLLSPKSVTKQTRMLDVTQVNARVEAGGYKPFVGRVRATLLDPDRFSVTLDDVWLAPAGG